MLAAAAFVIVATQAQAGDLFGGEGGGWELQAGAAAVVQPKYEGSKDYEVIGAPIIAPAGSAGEGVVSFKGIDDLRFRLLRSSGFEAGPLVGYRFDRDEKDAARLRGLGDVDGGLVIGGYVAYRMGALMPFASYHHQITGDDTGGVARFGLETKVPVSPWMTLTATGGTTWASSDYMESYFGISAQQSAASLAGLAQFDADSGFKDVYLSLGTDIPLADRWSLKLHGRYAHLIGDAADSPIVETESQWLGLVGITYRFGLDR